LKIYVSHSNVATQLKCGKIFNNYSIANCPQYAPLKKNSKNRLIFGEDMENDKVGLILGHSVHNNTKIKSSRLYIPSCILYGHTQLQISPLSPCPIQFH